MSFFLAAGRILFLGGYERGALGRALGMTLTMMPTVLDYLPTVVLIGGKGIGVIQI